MNRVLLLALLSLPGAFAFSNTVPFLAWSPHSSDVLTKLVPGARPSHDVLLQSIVSDRSVCSYDAVVVVDHPGVHSSDLRALEPSSRLATSIKRSPSARQLPYVEPPSLTSSPSAAALLRTQCGSIVIDVTPGLGGWDLEADRKHVLSVALPPLEGSPRYRKTVMAEHERLLSEELDRLAALAPNHLVIYAGSRVPLERRRLGSVSEFDSPSDEVASYAVPSLEPGILHNYQLLTPALITSLLVAFFILVPIVMLGISALASIQSTVRSEAPKDYSAQEKKTQ